MMIKSSARNYQADGGEPREAQLTKRRKRQAKGALSNNTSEYP